MRSLSFFAVLAVLITADSHAENTASELSVEFDPADAPITLRSSSRPVQLPNLTFVVRVEASCPAEQDSKSIVLSIADTRINLQEDEEGLIEESIRVPRKQLGPIAVSDFCMADDDASSGQQLLLRDVLSAQISLRCSGENQESMTYETVPLEVALQCDVPEDTQSL